MLTRSAHAVRGRAQSRNGQGSTTTGGNGSCVKSKSSDEIAEQLHLLAHGGARVRPPVGLGVEPLPAQEPVFDQLQVGVVAERLRVDEPRLGPRADHHRGHPQSPAVLVDHRRQHVVVEAAPVVPREEDRRAHPLLLGTFHHRVDRLRHVCLAHLDRIGRMLALVLLRHEPRDARQIAVPSVADELRVRADVVELPCRCRRRESRQGILHGRGEDALEVLARRRDAGAFADVVAPADTGLVEQPGDRRPHVRPRFPHLRRPDLRGLVRVDAAGGLLVRRARHRVIEIATGGRPCRDQEEVRRQRPRVGGREHAVVQRERLRVLPVDRQLLAGVIAHHVGLPLRPVDRLGAWLLIGVLVAPVADHAPSLDEAVHRPAVDRDLAADLAVGASLIDEVGVVIRAMTRAGPRRVRQACLRAAVRVDREAVGTGERAEVVIERPVLEHDEDQVVEVHDARGRVERTRTVGRRPELGRRTQRPLVDPEGSQRRVGFAEEVRRPQHVGRLGPAGVRGLRCGRGCRNVRRLRGRAR